MLKVVLNIEGDVEISVDPHENTYALYVFSFCNLIQLRNVTVKLSSLKIETKNVELRQLLLTDIFLSILPKMTHLYL